MSVPQQGIKAQSPNSFCLNLDELEAFCRVTDLRTQDVEGCGCGRDWRKAGSAGGRRLWEGVSGEEGGGLVVRGAA